MSGHTALFEAISGGSMDILVKLLKQGSVNMNRQNMEGATALGFAFCCNPDGHG
jgi:ankyrin repeat protein